MQSWLCEERLDELVMIFKANNIDGSEVNHMSKETVAELGIGEDRELIGLKSTLLFLITIIISIGYHATLNIVPKRLFDL